MMPFRLLACGLIVASFVCNLVLAEDVPPAITTPVGLGQRLEAIREKFDVPAIGAVIVTSDGVSLHRVVGVRRRGTEIAAENDDRFHLGSNTKAITAVWLATLVETGTLSWETPLKEAFPREEPWPSPVGEATLAQLLAHQAGLSANPPLGWRVAPREDSLAKLRRWFIEQELTHSTTIQVGEKFQYSNTGYVAASVLGEAETKSTWEAEVRRAVFEPLKMTSAGFGCQATRADPLDQPWPHLPDGKPIPSAFPCDNAPVLGPAGTVHCNLSDYGRFLVEQLRGARGQAALLKPATYQKLQTPYRGETGYAPGGWGVSQKNGHRELSHDGSNTVNYSTAWISPEENLAIAVCCNQGPKSGQQACHAALSLIRREYPRGEVPASR